MIEGHFDYLVVGGGAGGAVLARSLAEDSRCRVALLEAGPSDEGRLAVADLRRYQEVVAGPLTTRFPIVAPANGNERVVLPVGRVLGGSTSHNTCVWFRPPDSDFQDWEAFGAAGWGPAETGPCFDKLESRVHVETVAPEGAAQRDLLAAAGEIGLPWVEFARPFASGVGHFRLSKKGHRRQSASAVFLHPLAELPPNLAVVTDCEVERLVFGPDGAVSGVQTRRGELRAGREVILAAGALGSPKLLLLSGIGPAGQLAELGIPVRRDLPGVGVHLLDHPAACVNAAALADPGRCDPWNYAGVIFAAALPDAAWPDVEIQVGPELFEQQTSPLGYPSAPAGFCAYFTVNRARSEGSLRLVSADPRDAIIVDPNYFGDPEGYDLAVMIGAIGLARRLFAAPALRRWIGAELAPGAACDSEAEIADYVRHTVTTGYHAAGTCRMGAVDDPRSVVGPDLAVLGVPRLRVADASIFPSMVSVNIAPTCMMVGLRAAQLIRAAG
jgi:choline oxidase